MSAAREMLDAFHEALREECGRGNARLRRTLSDEEHRELVVELVTIEARESVGMVSTADRERLARELADVVYVAYGTAHAFAIDLDAALAEVHRAAMSKVDPATMRVRDDGKVLKPEGFVPPDMTAAVL